jgi:hypothetical protein
MEGVALLLVVSVIPVGAMAPRVVGSDSATQPPRRSRRKAVACHSIRIYTVRQSSSDISRSDST